MDSKVDCQVNMSSEPIALRFIPRVPKDRKQMILISVILVLLAIIIIGAILIGVYMTQQHTEKIIKITSSRGDGEVVEQTVMVNNQESVAAFHIQSNTTSATVVYDYKHELQITAPAPGDRTQSHPVDNAVADDPQTHRPDS
ncbi:pulmonary surfactant-associated protein C-like [Podarcis raffonei]|uniref:pulmonary surfactant-associated protein C-like n=1 Tax=Podarcis raffonei TaxID=65483 RepID=UPI0023295E81|nr:pulmonary surfactant-associated protein C-like [Podarcis raffonei]